MTLKEFLEYARQALGVVAQVHRDKASGMLEFELKELENFFMLLLLGSLVGIPSPPAAVAVELLPYLENELRLMIARADLAQDPLGALMGMLEID
jgi:hypothetical protein